MGVLEQHLLIWSLTRSIVVGRFKTQRLTIVINGIVCGILATARPHTLQVKDKERLVINIRVQEPIQYIFNLFRRLVMEGVAELV